MNFDSYKDNYEDLMNNSISFLKCPHDFYTKVKVDNILDLIKLYIHDTSNIRALDVGCGTGNTDFLIMPNIKEFYGVDVSRGVIDVASKKNPLAKYQLYDGENLPFSDNYFDLTFSICVMHHVPQKKWDKFLFELKRVTKKGGIFVVFEHNPLNPLTLKAVNNCEFDKNAELLKMSILEKKFEIVGYSNIEKKYILFFPFKNRIFGNIEKMISFVPLGAQYYICGIK